MKIDRKPMTDEERIRAIKKQLQYDELCVLYSKLDKPFSNIKSEENTHD